ncbi:MBL fold metallo-hydrolase [Alicyclobacillus ferrooxydans]|uniref:Metallo-beta-lactamase domain-containing protein n=1 Tax=Alicyclobacillus ferrooxydans TaxID=471514 RepID=A0A0N8PP02_9BACL|nr:MBL fold metallo-hydrolase [Alicyclobacillus ferrooxydans]KPV42957.1 hypothetical protein AN477_14855 [Alicyclobacillus ferrooxydans]
MWWIWLILILIAIILGAFTYLYAHYLKYRKQMPKPSYRYPEVRPDIENWRDDEVNIAWIGHATLLIKIYDLTIVTDPVFMQRVGMSPFPGIVIGPKRFTAPALKIKEVQDKVDLVLLSHAHLDHFDLPSLRRFARREAEVIIPQNTSKLVRHLPFGRISELKVRDSMETRQGATITAVPARHWGARYPWNRDYKWNGYVIDYKGVRVLFAGDTAMTKDYQDLGTWEPTIDVACMPIGAYSPDNFQTAHCTPEQAWQMFRDSKSKWLIPIHWGTLVLSMEPVDEPMERMMAAASKDGMADRVVVRRVGESFRLPPK